MIFRYILIIFLAFSSTPLCRLSHAEEPLLDLSCMHTIDCKQYTLLAQNISSVCLNHTCLCTDQTTTKVLACRVSSLDAAVNNQIGGKCPCKIQNATCSDNDFCVCTNGFVASQDKRRCLQKIVQLGDACELDSQCVQNSVFSTCDTNGKCQCLPNFGMYKNVCQSVIALDVNCQDEMSCVQRFANTICVHNHCMCDTGFVALSSNTECVPNLHFGDACIDSQQCSHNSGIGGLCANGTCSCSDDFVVAKLQTGNDTVYLCENKKAIGDTCIEDADCYQYHKDAEPPALACYLKECNCRTGYDRFQDRYCVKRSDSVSATATTSTTLLAIFVPLYLLL